jgi:hypothetical protein
MVECYCCGFIIIPTLQVYAVRNAAATQSAWLMASVKRNPTRQEPAELSLNHLAAVASEHGR